jgi:hypothetical protein
MLKDVYKFDELNDRAKETARDWFRQDYPGYEWWDSSYDDFATIADILGIDLRKKGVKLMDGSYRYDPEIYFSGFYHQGSGSSFVGKYTYAKGASRKIREYAPKDIVLHAIADSLQEVQRKAFYQLGAEISNYRDTWIRVSTWHEDRDATDAEDDAVKSAMEDFNHWIFRSLESEYEYLTSDESVDESISCNEYEFDEDGRPI